MSIIQEIERKKDFEKLFSYMMTFKKSLLKLENNQEKFKAFEFIDLILHKSINNHDICKECLAITSTVNIKILLNKYAGYNENDLLHFNAFCLIDNISLDYKRHC